MLYIMMFPFAPLGFRFLVLKVKRLPLRHIRRAFLCILTVLLGCTRAKPPDDTPTTERMLVGGTMGVKWVTYEDADPVEDMKRVLQGEEPLTASVQDRQKFGNVFLDSIIEWIGSEESTIGIDDVFGDDDVREYISGNYGPGDLYEVQVLINFVLQHATNGQLAELLTELEGRRIWR